MVTNEQEMRSIVHSACKEPTKGSRLMKQIVSALEMEISSEGSARISVGDTTS